MKALIRLMSVPAEKRDIPWLADALQAAIELEMSTIPPYLYAYWSIDQTSDPDGVAGVVRRVMVEEMLHMAIGCNLLAAIGGKPRIADSEVAKKYPRVLPKDVHQGLIVGLAKLSKPMILSTLMAIEEPQAHFVDDADFRPSGSNLIGDFYDSILTVFDALNPPLSPVGQVDLSDHFNQPYIATTKIEVHAFIGTIKSQGEGSPASPFEGQGQAQRPSHFYAFGQLFHGQKLRPETLTYTGGPVQFPAVRDLPDNPVDNGSAESKRFNQTYSDMLRMLQAAWDQGNASLLGDAVDVMRGGLEAAAAALIDAHQGPSFTFVDEGGLALEPRTTPDNPFVRVRTILDTAVGPGTFGAHGPFWRGKTRDQFVQARVFGQQLLVIGNGQGSNLVKALRAQLPFGSDQGTAGATFRRMPAGRPAVAAGDLDFMEHWINDGCPDPSAPGAANLSLTTGGQRPDPMIHVAFWRDFDDWAMFHVTPEVQDAVGVIFQVFATWRAFAGDPAAEPLFVSAVSSAAVRPAVAMLSERQKQTVESHYGVPVPLLAVLDGFERFGNDGLPDDPLRPGDPRHNMNGPIMWFIWSAFVEVCLQLNISPKFWRFYARLILCGMMNDGLFRGRFVVRGFGATPEGRTSIFRYVQEVPDADLPGELRRRYVESGL